MADGKRVSISAIELKKMAQAWQPLAETLRVPRNEREYGRLASVLDGLIDEVGENEAHPLAAQMDVLGVLIEKYEDEHVPQLNE